MNWVKKMEYFDVYDHDRNYLNKQMARGDKLPENEYNTGIEVYIINDNKILMTQRSQEKSHAGQWEVPGGCCQAGETIDQTIKREMKEEINVTLTEADYKFLATEIYHQQFVDIYLTNIKVDINQIKLQDEEVSAIKWVSKEELEIMIKEGKVVPSVLDRFLKIRHLLNLK